MTSPRADHGRAWGGEGRAGKVLLRLARVAAVCGLSWAAFVLSGCAGLADAEGVSDGTTDPACYSNADCAIGTCQFGICAEEPPVSMELALLLQPPAFRNDLSALHVTQLPVTLGSSLPDFALRAPIPVRGVVLFNAVGQDVGSPVEAELRFVSNRGIPGFEFEAATRSLPATGEYDILLPPGSYDVSIEPDRVDVSRTTAVSIEVRAQNEFRPFTITAPSQYLVVSGVLEREHGGTAPVAGAKVFARTMDGRLETTVDVTDEEGRFILLAPPTDAAYELNVRATDGSTWVPSAMFEPVVLTPDLLEAGLRLSLGAWEDPVAVTLALRTPDGAPVTEAVVEIRSELAPTSGRADSPGVAGGRYRRSIAADAIDADGMVTVSLPPGRAEIYAAPLSSALGLGLPVVIDVPRGAAVTDPVRVSVEARHEVSGRVVGSGGAGVSNVLVEARLEATDLLPLSRYGVPSNAYGATTTSDSDGRFTLQAQPGSWTLELIPPQDSGMARTRSRFDVERGPVDDLEVRLPGSGVVRGRLLDDGNQPLAGAIVQAFVITQGSALALAEGVTDAEGVYRLVLPRQ